MFDLYEKLLDIFLTACTIFYATLIVGIVCAFYCYMSSRSIR